ncbi:bifunctional glutamate N-acetyltransferase/amino-acid acetyltransferase ArgJ [Knoellia locipacati]|uniref:Arginine biosynthesis bifunctional protein ArgJ n=1 Tax=Knoellia locipacati TaxID=882824 RepID=A0A512T486_9MICO|nr:bifunctional glutamate N-acetyltransferase/amino-acid acetyltransferase ArgJ [Knoellia locipacati]GEQ15009.1 arginine biosynthesis bifunctional protein ArgJ [Knoellia locipacati]
MSVTSAQGFRAAGATAGLKASGSSDVALVVNDGPDHHVAAVFTSNRVEAAPVTWSRQAVSDGRADAVFLNSGGANACTGARGFQDTHRTAELVATTLGCSALDVVVCSTGLIGEFLPMERIEAGVGLTAEALATDGADDAARAIMTTDSVPKQATVSRDGWSVGGMAKGAGMLAPGLATMLCVVTTDVVTDAATLDAALRTATASTFDRVDSDGCMSTNDTVVLLASGASGVQADADEVTAAVTEVCASLARQLVADAEGASHDIAVEVRSAATELEAVEVARSVTRSNLFKAAIFGKDPNWGRVLAAVGTTDAAFDPTTIDVAVNGVQVCRSSSVGDDRDLVDLEPREVRVVIDLHAGDATATVWTNDLTHEYVHENSAYST